MSRGGGGEAAAVGPARGSTRPGPNGGCWRVGAHQLKHTTVSVQYGPSPVWTPINVVLAADEREALCCPCRRPTRDWLTRRCRK